MPKFSQIKAPEVVVSFGGVDFTVQVNTKYSTNEFKEFRKELEAKYPAKEVKQDDGTVKKEYDPASTAEALVFMVKDWDVFDDSDVKIPLEVEVILNKVPMTFANDALLALYDFINKGGLEKKT